MHTQIDYASLETHEVVQFPDEATTRERNLQPQQSLKNLTKSRGHSLRSAKPTETQ